MKTLYKSTKLLSLLLTLSTIILIVSCGGGGDDPAPIDVDPSDADALSGVLLIPGSQSVSGQPPAPSTAPGAPTVSNNQTSATVVADNTLYLPFNFESAQGYGGCYVQVNGASSYFDIADGNSAQDGLLVIPVGIPAGVQNGDFCLTYCIYDNSGQVSNLLQTCVTVGPIQECPAFTSGSDGLTIATYDLGETAGTSTITYDMYSVQDRVDVFYNDQWIGGSGSSISSASFPPVSSCGDGQNGYVSGVGTIDVNYDPSVARTVTIYMSGCIGGGTAWDLNVSCPE
ncbi:MAG: hypothetical protein RLN88_01150 [Ekhidna sp.]|uniref:hypothetical protein n=1 Tax=Ekhidna sp. TaxID=2608089 RepID=UPI0032ED38CB